MKKSLLEKLQQRMTVDPDTECWVWTGGCDMKGYPKAADNGKQFHVRRVFFEHYKKTSLKGREAVQTCDNIKCVNPNHIKSAKQGGHKYDSALPEDQVRQALLKRMEGHTWEKIQKLTGVSQGVPLRILKGKGTHKHLRPLVREAEEKYHESVQQRFQHKAVEAISRRAQGLNWDDACQGIITRDVLLKTVGGDPVLAEKMKQADLSYAQKKLVRVYGHLPAPGPFEVSPTLRTKIRRRSLKGIGSHTIACKLNVSEALVRRVLTQQALQLKQQGV